jgi:taurine dioxygenase
MSITATPLRADLSFGSRINGVTEEALRDKAVCDEIRQVFQERGLILFEDMAPSNRMQVQLSLVFGPLQGTSDSRS